MRKQSEVGLQLLNTPSKRSRKFRDYDSVKQLNLPLASDKIRKNYDTVRQSYQQDPDEFPELTIFRDILTVRRSLSPPYPQKNRPKKLLTTNEIQPSISSPIAHSSKSTHIPLALSPPTPIESRLAPFNSNSLIQKKVHRNGSMLELHNNNTSNAVLILKDNYLQ